MRYILVFWALPMGLIWGWYFLSANDLHMGSIYFSKGFNDLVFQIYGQILGIDPATIPSMLAKACIIDTGLIFGILAFRRRKDIAAWWNDRRAKPVAAQEDNLANLSNAP